MTGPANWLKDAIYFMKTNSHLMEIHSDKSLWMVEEMVEVNKPVKKERTPTAIRCSPSLA